MYPKLRFKGFDDAWEQRELEEWGTFYYGRSCPKWSVTEDATTPCIRYGELYTKFGAKIDKVYSYTNIAPENLRFSKGTEVLVPRVGEDPMDYNHCTWLSIPNVAIGEMISVYNTNQNPLFTAIMFNATLKDEFAKRVEGGSVTNLYYEKLKNIKVSFPSLKEQEKISAYFDKLDNLITLHQRQCEALKKQKQFFLQNMFPKEGESEPRIRFNGFTEPWEQRKLGDIGTTYTGLSGKSKNDFGHGEAKYIPYINIFNNPKVDISRLDSIEIDKKQNCVKRGDVLFTTSSETPEEVGMSSVVCEDIENTYLNSFCFGFRPVKVFDLDFLAFLFRSDFFRKQIVLLAQGISRYNISKTKAMNIDLLIPNMEEQIKIGSLFANIEETITLHQRQYEQLISLKKYLLSKMFI